ncbi:MAG: hypothetical protein AB8B64_12800 [Granulosicoccus sp.]
MEARNRKQAKPQTQFDINIGELDIIEQALRHQAHALSQETLKQQDLEKALSCETYRSRMTAIQSVLGKLHNQKVWFVPKEPVPLG